MVMMSLVWLFMSGCATTSGDAAVEAGRSPLEAYATGGNALSAGLITDDAKCEETPFILSGKTGEAAIGMENSIANPAQSTISKRGHGGGRGSLTCAISGPADWEVAASGLGMSASKHIFHHSHSLLLRICVLRI